MSYVKLLAILVVLLLGLAHVLPYLTGEQAPSGSRERIPARARPGGLVPSGGMMHVPGRDTVAAGDTPAPLLSQQEMDSLSSLKDGDTAVEHEPLMLVVRKVKDAEPEALRSLADRTITFTDLCVTPEAHRGRVVRFVGKLARLEPSEMAAPELGVDALYEGQVVGPHFTVCSFYLTHRPDHLAVGEDMVEVVGAFLKNISYETRTGGRQETPLLIARELRRYVDGREPVPSSPEAPGPAPLPRPTPRSDEPPKGPFLDKFERLVLDDIADQPVRLQSEPFMFMLRKVAQTAPEGLESYVDARITYDCFVDDPAPYRGRVVRFTGTLMRLTKSGVDAAEAGLDSLYEGQVMNASFELYSFYLTDPPQGFSVGDDIVELVGVYYTNIAFQTQSGRYKATPLVIARRLKHHVKSQPPPRPGAADVVWDRLRDRPALLGVLSVLAVTLVTLAIVVAVRGRARGSLRDRVIRHRLSEIDREIDDTD